MKNINRFLLIGLACVLLAGATISCKKEGPMEKAGKKVDEVVEDAQKAVDKD